MGLRLNNRALNVSKHVVYMAEACRNRTTAYKTFNRISKLIESVNIAHRPQVLGKDHREIVGSKRANHAIILSVRGRASTLGETEMQPSTAQTFPVQKSGLDLNTFEDVTLVKDFNFTPVTNINEATARLGNDAAKLIDVINDGLRAEEQRKARADNSGWFVEDEKGKRTEFTGQLADGKLVNPLVLTLAKTVFGYDSEKPIEDRRAAKQSAIDMIKNTPAILDNLKKNAATAPPSE